MSVTPLYLLQFEEISYRQTKLTYVYIIYFNLTTYFDSMCASSGNNMKFIQSHVYCGGSMSISLTKGLCILASVSFFPWVVKQDGEVYVVSCLVYCFSPTYTVVMKGINNGYLNFTFNPIHVDISNFLWKYLKLLKFGLKIWILCFCISA
jgi:hypothetical protein